MSGIFGKLGLADTDRVFQATVGQRVIYEVAMEYISKVNAAIDAAVSVFAEETTSEFKRRYKLAGGGRLSKRGTDGTYGAGKVYGYWDVAFPLEDFGREIAGDDVSMAYMSVRELENHINTVVAQNVNTVRWEILHALFDNVQGTFVDPLHGSLSIEPLANGDTVVYPPVIGSESEATEDHYLESSYAATAISDSNNPYVTMRDDLVHHNEISGEGYNIVSFINAAEEPETEDLTDFDPVTDMYTRPGANTAEVFGLPAGLPGAVIGRTNGVWVVRWDWIPASYMLSIDLDQPKPLIRRVDPADTRLGEGLQLVAENEEFPFKVSTWRHRFGFGGGNRLNGVVMELGTGGTYTIPTSYD
jgi:hypothetical protein